MYHTGTPETGWRRQALMNGESAVCVFTPGIVSHALSLKRSGDTPPKIHGLCLDTCQHRKESLGELGCLARKERQNDR
jgi:hypothetical protein